MIEASLVDHGAHDNNKALYIGDQIEANYLMKYLHTIANESDDV